MHERKAKAEAAEDHPPGWSEPDDPAIGSCSWGHRDGKVFGTTS
ncbi:hypothetical protein [Pseudanabaena sp. FACHB-2040]|nr:hypothetical protein [Pseudanabaena sp. FACHB-2040]